MCQRWRSGPGGQNDTDWRPLDLVVTRRHRNGYVFAGLSQRYRAHSVRSEVDVKQRIDCVLSQHSSKFSVRIPSGLCFSCALKVSPLAPTSSLTLVSPRASSLWSTRLGIYNNVDMEHATRHLQQYRYGHCNVMVERLRIE